MSNGYKLLKNRGSKKCLQAHQRDGKDHADAIMKECDSSNTAQGFKYNGGSNFHKDLVNPESGFEFLSNQLTGKCLDGKGPTLNPNTPLYFWWCADGNRAHGWKSPDV